MTSPNRTFRLCRLLTASTLAAAASVAVAIAPANAATGSAPASAPPLQHQAYVMLGHIEVADVALLNDFPNDAAMHVHQALTLARKLEGQTASLNATSIKAGHLQYTDGSGQKHDYWLPVINDRMVVDNLSETFGNRDKPTRAAEEAQLVTVTTSIDVKAIRTDLEKASKALAAKNDAGAQVALRDAERNVFSEQSTQNEPLASVHDNLVLARELLKSKDDRAASVALRHASDSLKDYRQQQKQQAKSARVVKLQGQIDQLQSNLAKDRPSLLAKADTQINHWIQDIKTL